MSKKNNSGNKSGTSKNIKNQPKTYSNKIGESKAQQDSLKKGGEVSTRPVKKKK